MIRAAMKLKDDGVKAPNKHPREAGAPDAGVFRCWAARQRAGPCGIRRVHAEPAA